MISNKHKPCHIPQMRLHRNASLICTFIPIQRQVTLMNTYILFFRIEKLISILSFAYLLLLVEIITAVNLSFANTQRLQQNYSGILGFVSLNTRAIWAILTVNLNGLKYAFYKQEPYFIYLLHFEIHGFNLWRSQWLSECRNNCTREVRNTSDTGSLI